MIGSLLFCFAICIYANPNNVEKYLYLGKHNCDAIGNEAYLDQPNSGNITICSSIIPMVNPQGNNGFNPNEIDLLTIVILEADTYSGFEQLNGYSHINIIKNYIDDKNVTFVISESPSTDSLRIIQFEVSDEINIILEISSKDLSNNSGISNLKLHGSSHAYLYGVQTNNLLIYVDNNLILDDYLSTYENMISFIGSNNVKIIDNNKILNNKAIVLDGVNLEYVGDSQYHIGQITYSGSETIKRNNNKDPKVSIDFVQLILLSNTQMTEFIDAEVDQLYIQSNNNIYTLTINTSSTVFLPLYKIQNTIINALNKIDIEDNSLIITNIPIPISSFSGKTKNGQDLKIIYQNIENSMIIASVFSEDISDSGFDTAFLQYQNKLIESIHKEITIPSSKFEGMTSIDELKIKCPDSTCEMEILLDTGSGKLYNKDSIEIEPKYFKVEIQQSTISFQPMKADVQLFNFMPILNPNINIELKNFSGAEKTLYKFDYDIYANSITLDENIEIQFDCNLHLQQQIIIPKQSKIIDSPESGIGIYYESTFIQLEPLSTTYSKKFNKITILESNLLQNHHLIVKDLGSQTNEFNLITFIFANEDVENDDNPFILNLYKITSCKNVVLDFQSLYVLVNENSIKIDKKTLDYNPKFTCHKQLYMGNLSTINSDVFIFSRKYNGIYAIPYTNLYLDGNFIILQKNLYDTLEVSKTLFVNGMLSTKICKVEARNLIFNPKGNSSYLPSIKVTNSLFTSSIEDFTTISTIKSPKLVISGIDSNQDIIIHHQKLTLQKKSKSYEIDTSLHSKIILYLTHLDVDTTRSISEGNKINLKVENSENLHKVVDFNVLPNDDNKLNAQSLLKFVFHESISTGNPKFDGTFGYAFDQNLIGDVVYKEGENGNEFIEKPSYFPIDQVEIEPFVDVEPDSEPDITSNDQSDEQTIDNSIEQTDESSNSQSDQEPDIKPDEHPTKPGKKGLKPGVIAGIVIGSVVGAALIITGFVFLIKKTCCHDA